MNNNRKERFLFKDEEYSQHQLWFNFGTGKNIFLAEK